MRMTWPKVLFLLALAAGPVGAGEFAAIAVMQATEVDGTPLERALVGAGAPVGALLPFHVALDFSCPAGTERRQLFVSVADTVRMQDAAEEASSQMLRVEVPLRQLQWLAEPARLCGSVAPQRPPDEFGDGGLRYFRLHSGAAAYATVTCRGPGPRVAAATSSAPLDVWLSCPAGDAAEPPSRPPGR
jgi:hypothetical protein